MPNNPFEVQTLNPFQALLYGQQSYDSGQKRSQENATKSALATLLGGGMGADGQPDWQGTARSLAAGGNLDGAVKVGTLAKTFSPETSADLQAYNYATKNNGFKGSLLDFMKEKAAAGATRVSNNSTVNTGGGGSDKQIYDSLEESAKGARTAATGLTGITQARKAMTGPGGVITGFGADERLGLAKVGSFLGITDPAAIQNTETFRSAIAPQVAAMLKATVGSANISNSDREFAEKAAGGSIKLDGGTIHRLLGIMEAAGREVVADHSRKLDAVYPADPKDPNKFRRERALFGVRNVPPAAQQVPPAQGTIDPAASLNAARAAIQANPAARAQIIKKLTDNGINPSGL